MTISSAPSLDYGAVTNLVSNGGFETNTTGWSDGANVTLSRSTEQAHSGVASGKAVMDTTNAGENACGFITVTAAAAGAHVWSAWVYVPTAWSGGTIALDTSGWTGLSPADGTNVNADMALRDQWQRIVAPITVDSGDLSGAVRVVVIGIVSGEFIYIDDAQFEAGAVATPYIATDGGTASRSATAIALPTFSLNGGRGHIA